MLPISDTIIEQVHTIIQTAVHRSGGNWRMSFKPEVTEVFKAIGYSFDAGDVVSQKID